MKSNPPPVPNNSDPIWPKAIEDFRRHHGRLEGRSAEIVSDICYDMRARDAEGRKHYGMPLQAHNGRNAIKDGYEEILDAIVYCRQQIEEDQTQVQEFDISSPQGFVISRRSKLQNVMLEKIYLELMNIALEMKGMINE